MRSVSNDNGSVVSSVTVRQHEQRQDPEAEAAKGIHLNRWIIFLFFSFFLIAPHVLFIFLCKMSLYFRSCPHLAPVSLSYSTIIHTLAGCQIIYCASVASASINNPRCSACWLVMPEFTLFICLLGLTACSWPTAFWQPIKHHFAHTWLSVSVSLQIPNIHCQECHTHIFPFSTSVVWIVLQFHAAWLRSEKDCGHSLKKPTLAVCRKQDTNCTLRCQRQTLCISNMSPLVTRYSVIFPAPTQEPISLGWPPHTKKQDTQTKIPARKVKS